MRICFVLHQFLPRHVTGTEQYVRSVALGLLRRGHQVQVFAFEPLIQHEAPGKLWLERDDEVEGIAVRRVSVHPQVSPNAELADYENPLAARLLERFLAARHFDLVHVFHARNIGTAAITAPRALGMPVVVNLMDFWFLCANFTLLRRSGELCLGPPEGGLGCIPCMSPQLAALVDDAGTAVELRRLGEHDDVPAAQRGGVAARAHALIARKARLFAVLAQADAILAPSRFVQRMFEDAGFPGQRIRHVPYGVDPGRLQHAPAAPRSERHLAIGYVGSITPHKGLHVLLGAVRRLQRTGWRLDVHGDPDTHPAYGRRIRRLAGRERRIALRGPFPPAELGSVLASLDLVVVPSLWYENTPFSILEALACRLPVVASRLGGITEVVEEGRNGLLFAAGDRDALREVLERLLDDPTQLERVRAGPLPRTLEANLDDFESIYESVLRRTPAVP